MIKYPKSTFIFFFVFLSVWIFFQTQIRISADGLWLTLATQKFLNHIPMTVGYFDNNPPMSYMIYAPAVWVSDLLNIDLEFGYHTYIFTLIFLSFFLLFFLFQSSKEYKPEAVLAILTGYLVSTLFIGFAEFGQKDHIIAITLPVFIFAQYALTQKHKIPRAYLHLAFIIGTPFILLKPHFGLLAVALLLHRFYKKPSIHILRDPDFIYLSIGTVAYLFMSIFFFSDYITIALPFAMDLYVSIVSYKVIEIGIWLSVFLICLLTGVALQGSSKKEQDLNILFVFMALLSALVFVIQAKGFSVHLIPVFSFLMPALLLCIWVFITKILKKRHYVVAVLINILVLMSFAFLVIHSDRYHYLSKAAYTESALGSYIKENNKDSSIFIEAWSTNIIVPNCYYHDIQLAHRFASTWFVPILFYALETKMEKAPAYKKMLGDYVLEDLQKYQPRILLLFSDEYEKQNLLNLYQGDPLSEYIHTYYNKGESLSLSLGPLFFYDRNFYIYDVYTKKE